MNLDLEVAKRLYPDAEAKTDNTPDEPCKEYDADCTKVRNPWYCWANPSPVDSTGYCVEVIKRAQCMREIVKQEKNDD